MMHRTAKILLLLPIVNQGKTIKAPIVFSERNTRNVTAFAVYNLGEALYNRVKRGVLLSCSLLFHRGLDHAETYFTILGNDFPNVFVTGVLSRRYIPSQSRDR